MQIKKIIRYLLHISIRSCKSSRVFLELKLAFMHFISYLTHWSFRIGYKKRRAQEHDEEVLRWHDVFLFTLSHLTLVYSTLLIFAAPITPPEVVPGQGQYGDCIIGMDDISMVHLTYPGIPCETPRVHTEKHQPSRRTI